MQAQVLIVTPATGFGELIRQTLQEKGQYHVVLTNDSSQALSYAGSSSFSLAILDGDLSETPINQLCQSLLEKQPHLRLVIIPPENNPEHTSLAGLKFDGYLTKPFYLPDLLDTVAEVLGLRPGEVFPRAMLEPDDKWDVRAGSVQGQQPLMRVVYSNASKPPPWLQDINQAARRLMSLSLESEAMASLIIRGKSLWAYSGELPQPAVEELAHLLAQHWERGGGSDLARYVKLTAVAGEHMLYATSLGDDYVLGMLFEAETPFSEIRTQSGSLARALAEPPDDKTLDKPRIDDHLDEESSGLSEQGAPDDEFLRINWDSLPDGPEETGETHSPDLDEQKQVESAISADQNDGQITRASLKMIFSEQEQNRQAHASDFGYTLNTSEQLNEVLIQDEDYEQQSGEDLETEDEHISLEPISAAVYHLNYACVLIPRLPKHYLIGDLAARLSEWVAQISLAFSWRLEYLAVRPEYLQWIVNVPPATSPSHILKIMRQHTSKRIFDEFARLREENPSGDFWAPGFLILGSDHPAPANIIKDFIHQTRRRQGIIAPRFSNK